MPFAWITADEAYGQVKYLRTWLEERDAAYVLATKVNDTLITTDGGETRADELIAALPQRSWRRLSVGAGAHGTREYDWARMPTRIGWPAGRGHWLLARRSISDPTEIAYYVCYGSRRSTLLDLAWIVGTRWRIEECFQQAKNEAGLDHYQVRSWRAWYAHITLSMLAHAWLTVSRSLAIKGNRCRRTRHDRIHATGDPAPAHQTRPACRRHRRTHLGLVTLPPTPTTPSPPQPLPTTRLSTHLSAVAVIRRSSPLSRLQVIDGHANSPECGPPSAAVAQPRRSRLPGPAGPEVAEERCLQASHVRFAQDRAGDGSAA